VLFVVFVNFNYYYKGLHFPATKRYIMNDKTYMVYR